MNFIKRSKRKGSQSFIGEILLTVHVPAKQLKGLSHGGYTVSIQIRCEPAQID